VHNSDDNEKLLAMPPLVVDTDKAFSRFGALTQEVREVRGARRAVAPFVVLRPAKWLAAAAGVVIVATTLTMTGVADSIFQIFEARQFAAVNVTPTDIQTLGQLSEFGTLTWSSQPMPHQTATLAEATAETGLPAISVTPPSSVSGTPKYGAMPKTTATFVFDSSKASASAAAIGRTAPPMPAKLNGSTLIFTGGPAIIVSYSAPSSGTQAPAGNVLFVGVAKAPTGSSDGASVAELQAYLLAQPSISPALAAQIRAMGDPASTLPIPVPVGQATATNVSVHGTNGLFIGDSTGLGSGVLWQQGGLVYAVGGSLTQAQVIAVANSLK
jgi:hypothetical protein